MLSQKYWRCTWFGNNRQGGCQTWEDGLSAPSHPYPVRSANDRDAQKFCIKGAALTPGSRKAARWIGWGYFSEASELLPNNEKAGNRPGDVDK
jgi:hypothetical protein